MSNAKFLFETNALKIAPSDKPFWYTSGLIGPYFINTHFLCGGENTAIEILSDIDNKADDVKTFPSFITSRLEDVYNSYPIYKEVIDKLCEEVSATIKNLDIKYISGGQRRDWFFSPIIAKKLNIPCLYIYNDLKIFDENGEPVTDIENTNVINIADLLTIGSSYTSKWAPAIKKVNGTLIASANAVDRHQGGDENLKSAGIKENIAIIDISKDLFDEALSSKYITQDQYEMVISFLNDDFSSMKSWLENNKDFVDNSLASSDEKTAKRAKLMIDTNPYKLALA